MGKFRHTVRRWRSAILGEKENRVAARCRPPGTTNASVEELRMRDVEPLLDLGALTISGTWMDLPQEVVDYIVSMLGSDLQSLKACSLTCKTMFVSTRCVIHRKICLTWEKNWELLTAAERQRYIRGERQGPAVRVLSSIAAHGLLQYARYLSINLDRIFTPANLLPFNYHFQRLDRIQDLTIYRLDTPGFLESFDTYFVNFVPTLRSLHLEVPAGDSRQILDFICRFPHLEDLSLEVSSRDYNDWRIWKSGSSPVVKSMPPFRGRLRLRGITKWRGYLLQQLISLPGKRCFRFIDFRACSAEVEQPIVDACSGTLESVSTTWRKFYRDKGLPLNLTDATNLHSFALRIDFDVIRYPYEALSQTLSTITSPFFSEFVLEVEGTPMSYETPQSAWICWGAWTELDKMFERIDIERGFRVVIRTESVEQELNITAEAEIRLPLMAARKGIVSEAGPFPKK